MSSIAAGAKVNLRNAHPQPTDFRSAQRLAELDKFQFQHWALSLIDARPLKEAKARAQIAAWTAGR